VSHSWLESVRACKQGLNPFFEDGSQIACLETSDLPQTSSQLAHKTLFLSWRVLGASSPTSVACGVGANAPPLPRAHVCVGYQGCPAQAPLPEHFALAESLRNKALRNPPTKQHAATTCKHATKTRDPLCDCCCCKKPSSVRILVNKLSGGWSTTVQ